jgi:hypothetical protein
MQNRASFKLQVPTVHQYQSNISQTKHGFGRGEREAADLTLAAQTMVLEKPFLRNQ